MTFEQESLWHMSFGNLWQEGDGWFKSKLKTVKQQKRHHGHSKWKQRCLLNKILLFSLLIPSKPSFLFSPKLKDSVFPWPKWILIPFSHHILPLKPPFFLFPRQEEWKILWHEPKQLLSQLPLGQHYRPPAPGKKIELILYFAYFVIKLWLQSGKNVQGLFFIIGFEPLFSAILEVSILLVPFTCGSSTMTVVTALL